MRTIELIRGFLTDKMKRKMYLLKAKDSIIHIPDREYIEKLFYIKLGYRPNLDNPQTLCEKLNWLKLYDRKPEYTAMVDKYAAKQYVTSKVGAEHVTPLLGVWERFDEIDFTQLPEQFVLKCTHDGVPVICTNKSQFDKEKARKIFAKKLRTNYYKHNREWPYKNVKPRIIAEEYIDSLGRRTSVEYKLTCFNGKVDFITICTGIAHSTLDVRNNDFYDREWNYLPFYAYYKNTNKVVPKPDFMDRMIEIAEKLAEGIPYLRVDFYYANDRIIVGEMTFFTWGGYIVFTPEEWDKILGDRLILPPKYIND